MAMLLNNLLTMALFIPRMVFIGVSKTVLIGVQEMMFPKIGLLCIKAIPQSLEPQPVVSIQSDIGNLLWIRWGSRTRINCPPSRNIMFHNPRWKYAWIIWADVYQMNPYQSFYGMCHIKIGIDRGFFLIHTLSFSKSAQFSPWHVYGKDCNAGKYV